MLLGFFYSDPKLLEQDEIHEIRESLSQELVLARDDLKLKIDVLGQGKSAINEAP